MSTLFNHLPRLSRGDSPRSHLAAACTASRVKTKQQDRPQKCAGDEAGLNDAFLPSCSIFATSFAEATARQESCDVQVSGKGMWVNVTIRLRSPRRPSARPTTAGSSEGEQDGATGSESSEKSAVNLASVTKCDQIQNVFLSVEIVDDSVIASAQPIFGTVFQPMMRILAHSRSEVVNLCFNQLAHRWR